MLIAGIVGGIVVLCVVCGVFGYLHDKKTQQTYGALTAACEGRPVAGARAYTPGAGVHRVVGAEQSGGSWRIANGRIPNDQLPQGVSDAEVVACFGAESQTTLGTCDFYSTRYGVRVPGTNRTYTRTQKFTSIRLVAAATGQTITTGSVAGPMPIQCSQNVGRPSTTTFQGSAPGSSEVGPWITSVLASGGAGMVPMGY